MPKQGQFAKNVQQPKIKQFKVKHQTHHSQIKDDQFTDFLVVRFALTAKKRLTVLSAETAQRLLMEIAGRLRPGNNDLGQVVTTTLTELQSRVPWQFNRQVLSSWEILQTFLLKEVPAVPVSQVVRLSNPMSELKLRELIATLLAKQATAITFLKRPVSNTIRQQTMVRLQLVIYLNQQINWKQVAALFAPFPFQIDDQLDAGTQKWFQELIDS